MANLGEMLEPYITRFKEEYQELEEETGDDERTGSEKRDWMKKRVQSAFSKEKIDQLSKEEAIDILSNFYAIQFGGGRGSKSEKESKDWAAGIINQGFVKKVRNLLYGKDAFEIGFYKVMETHDLGYGILTEFLCYYDPQKYGPILTSSEKALTIFGLDDIDIPKTGKRSGEYALAFFEKLKEILQEFKKDPIFKDADLCTLDYLLYFVNKSQFWRIAGGKNGKYWEDGTWQKFNIASFGFTGLEPMLGERIISGSEEELDTAYSKVYPAKSAQNRHETVKLLKNFTQDIQTGDVLIVNKGKTAILGYGIVKSNPRYFDQYHNADLALNREVIWIKQFSDYPVPEDLKEKFVQTVTKLPDSSAKKLLRKSGKPIPTGVLKLSTEYQKIAELLDHKKQIILYGPPGTGKTYLANKFISNVGQENYGISEKTLLDQRVFLLIVYIPRDEDILKLKPKAHFTYGWAEGRNWQYYYDQMQEGDLVLAYFQNQHRISSVLKCVQKENNRKNENGEMESSGIKFEIVSHFDGPTFQEMKKDPILKDSDIMRGSFGFSLKSLKLSELDRIIQISEGISSQDLGITEERVDKIVNNKEFVTFHPSFGYEDFIEGLRPFTKEGGTLGYRVEDGIFKTFSRDAFNVLASNSEIKKEWADSEGLPDLTSEEKERLIANSSKFPFYLIIDEINRGDISRIFGELITLLEADKRYGENNEIVTTLPYSKQKFAIPPNLFILGTMNTADKSIALIDLALRRRFGFIECMPDYAVLSTMLDEQSSDTKEIGNLAIKLLKNINEKIIGNYDRDHQIGHSYLTKFKDVDSGKAAGLLHYIWYHEIIPLLQEYYYDSPKKLKEILGPDFVLLENNERAVKFPEPLPEGQLIEALQKLTNPQPQENLSQDN